MLADSICVNPQYPRYPRAIRYIERAVPMRFWFRVPSFEFWDSVVLI